MADTLKFSTITKSTSLCSSFYCSPKKNY